MKTIEIPKTYNSKNTESKWYDHWMAMKFFHSEPDDRVPYTIVIPPPNVTGVLHMGHMLNNTLQDVLIRRARMKGFNACWVPGTDHASIATEAKVTNMLKEKGIDKNSLTREEFLKYAWEWNEKHGGIILQQLKRLGASCDWDRTRFTMEPALSESVIDVFIDLYKKGKIYRGVRMINWDPKANTALSDEEVLYKEVNSKLYYIRYKIADSEDEWIEIATTRPETILGDTAICVNPEDKRYLHLHGKKALVPLIDREIPIIADNYVDIDFGTGALKITPAHDINDYELGLKHNLETIDILNDDGTLNENAELYIGQDRFVVRKQIGKDLEEYGYLVKEEDIINKVGFSERTDAVIEPKLSLQWFCTVKELAVPALENVMNNNIRFFPDKFKNTYRHWMENVKDWCISRQLWWGQRIPAWYYGKGPNDFVVAKTDEEALKAAKEKTKKENLTLMQLHQDEDVLDTWFSSWLWPISVFDGIKNPDNKDINYYYPTNDLVTAPEILFFWVARMIMAGYEYKGEKPFKNVYLTGIVRDKLGRKMSKSLGNSPDPIGLMNKYGADGVRIGMLLSSPAGNDLLFDEQLCEQGRNFCNKIWNSFRLISSWEVHPTLEQPEINQTAAEWFSSKFNESLHTAEDHYSKYRISDALMTTYKLVWDDFCSWYLEMIKPAYKMPIDKQTYETTLSFFEDLLKTVHPFMPFITEELWHLIRDRKKEDCIMVSEWPELETFDKKLIRGFKEAEQIVSKIRKFRKEKNIPNRNAFELWIKENEPRERKFDRVIEKLGNVKEMHLTEEKPKDAFSFLVGRNEYFIPIQGTVNIEEEKNKLEEELNYNRGFLKSVMKKLGNEKFVANAPREVIEREEKKKNDAEAKIKALEEQLTSLQA